MGDFPTKFNIFNGFLIFFEGLGCIMTKWIPRFHFPNFLSIIVDFHSSSISFQRNLQSLDKAGLLNQFGPFLDLMWGFSGFSPYLNCILVVVDSAIYIALWLKGKKGILYLGVMHPKSGPICIYFVCIIMIILYL